ncbi:MAG TPA: hypothetical protein VFF06_03390 [Polyangia bacterium]|nr:hypothetical protein [Polyangia bacterium]
MVEDDAGENGARVTGTIERIRLHGVPSIFAGVPDRPVTRIALAVERAVDARGAAVDAASWIGLEFEAAPELAEAFTVGERVEIVTTTATGLHVARIRRAPAS